MTDQERLRRFALRVYNEMPCTCGSNGVCACPVAEAGKIIKDLGAVSEVRFHG